MKVTDEHLRIEAISELLKLGKPYALNMALLELDHALKEKRYFGRLCLAFRGIRLEKDNVHFLFVLWKAMLEGTGQGEDIAFDIIAHLDCTTLLDNIINHLRLLSTQDGLRQKNGGVFNCFHPSERLAQSKPLSSLVCILMIIVVLQSLKRCGG